MINIIKPLFSYLRAAIRSRDPTRQRGQSLVEYALILSIISIVLVGVAAASVSSSSSRVIPSHQAATAGNPVPLCAPGLPTCPGK